MYQRFDDCFAELGGFALVDAARLDQELKGALEGCDVLTRLLTSDFGDLVLSQGIIVPLLGITPGYYRLVIRDRAEPPTIESPRVESPGWVLATETGRLTLCGLGYLADFRAARAAHRAVTVPPGTYEVRILGAQLRAEESDDEGVYELILSRTDGTTTATGSTTLSLSLFD